MKIAKKNIPKITIVVRRGMVESVFTNKSFGDAEVNIVDLDTTDPVEYRKKALRAKKARKILNQIF